MTSAMVVARLSGGLGNQLFQYAAGRALADHHGVPLQLDLRSYQNRTPGETPRKFLLDRMKVQWQEATGATLPSYKLPTSRLGRWARKFSQPSYRREKKNFVYDPSFLNGPAFIYLDGYWQCPQYFAGVETRVRREFEVVDPPDAQNAEWISKIESGPSCALHVRRGDYVTHVNAQAFHGTCDLGYYASAMSKLSIHAQKAGADRLRVFVFSDDLAWAKDHLPEVAPPGVVCEFVDANSTDHPELDLRLMSRCTHHIIANSSLSWWGAYLGQTSQQQVIAPLRWISDPGQLVRDLFPKNWSRI